ncbi:MAG: potassium transporter Trk [Planctomycetota bacterium]|nr:MAG: potassium transporter Trk [Planctomycetota bacterium]
MQITYKNKQMERVLIGVNALTAAAVVASYLCLFGFDEPLLPVWILYAVQVALLCVFVAEKITRLFNAVSKPDFWRANWFEIPFLIALAVIVFGAGKWFAKADPTAVRHFAVGIYLVLQVVIKLSRTSVNMAASGKNPTLTLIASFLVLIISGAGLLMLPRSSATENVSFVDALFTATSATCVTGLIVKDTGRDFSLMGQVIILSLIQLGGLGIVVFGAVFALLLGQALSLRESVAMQDLLSARTLGRIGNMIGFIFVGTIFIEAIGAVSLFGMWDDVPGRVANVQQQWFCSIFHSISSFCNAGFSLFSDSFIGYSKNWRIYVVVCPLIVLGGLGFGVLYDLANIAADRVKRFFKKCFRKTYRFSMETPKRMSLQTKIVLSVSAGLIILGALAILLFERYAGGGDSTGNPGMLGALFQSITARTAGFNTIDVSEMSPSSRFVLILLMFIGGSPGSTAGGIKTVTLAVIIMTAVAALRKRREVEMFKRSVRIVVVGRAITVTLLFVVVLFGATLILTITENANGFTMSQIAFESASALGTVGLTTGITPALTTAGKLIIIVVMLIGRLGPLTLLATLTFNLKPARYSYPSEAIIVG